jgi:hypothetical protein
MFAKPGSNEWQAICVAKQYFVGLCLRAGFFFLSINDDAVHPPFEDAMALVKNKFNVNLPVNDDMKEVVGFKYSG